MDCIAAREAISALLDGERPGVGDAWLESHLATCAACRDWREQAHEVTRRARLAEAAPAPLPDPSLLAKARALERRGSWWRTLALTRIGLVLVGLAQIALSLPDLTGSYRDAPIHVAHEMGALDLALAVGFLVAAYRPARAQGMRALVGCAALLLIATAVLDLLAGRTSLGDEAPHLLVLAGWLLLRRAATLMPPEEEDGLARGPRRSWRGWIAPPWGVDRWGLRPRREDGGQIDREDTARETPMIGAPETPAEVAPRRSAQGG